MGILNKILSSGAGTLVEKVADVADRFIETDADKKAFEIEMRQLALEEFKTIESSVQARFHTVRDIIVAEMKHGDAYVSRMRPTIGYAGILLIIVNYPITHWFGGTPAVLPQEFWWAWGGVVGLYTLGRSYEKSTGKGRMKWATGSATTTTEEQEL